jgi:hypothetical protein
MTDCLARCGTLTLSCLCRQSMAPLGAMLAGLVCEAMTRLLLFSRLRATDLLCLNLLPLTFCFSFFFKTILLGVKHLIMYEGTECVLLLKRMCTDNVEKRPSPLCLRNKYIRTRLLY